MNTAVFVDTSAIYALLDRSDGKHSDATRIWSDQLATSEVRLLTTNYVIAETFDLVRRRLGMEALRDLDNFVSDTLIVHFVGEKLHDAARRRLFIENRRALSLVDCTSLEFGGRENITHAFAFDRHLGEGAFELLSAT